MELSLRKRAFEEARSAYVAAPVRRTRYYLDAYLERLCSPPIAREAAALRAYWEQADIVRLPGEELAGYLPMSEPAGFLYGSATWISRENAAALADQERYGQEERAALERDLAAVDAARYHPACPDVYSREESASIAAHAATSTWFAGHMVLDFQRVLDIGLDGYRRDVAVMRAIRPDAAVLQDAMDDVLAGARAYILRCADAAGEGAVRENLLAIAEGPPATFHQALQLVWMLHMLNGYDSFGRFDDYMAPFYRRDLAEGRITYSRARELVAELYFKVELCAYIQNMTIGGTDGAGRDMYNDLTAVAMDVAAELRYKGPNLCLRVTPTMPGELMDKALACIATGLGLPALYNDGVYVFSLVRHGIPLEEARGYCLAGCSQVMVPGRCHFVNDIGMFNAGKILEIALNGGIDPRTGERVGPQTPPLADAQSFAQVLEAFYAQLAYFAGVEVSIHNKEIAYRAGREGYALRTLFTRDCLAKGLPVNEGGARYNNIQLEIIGITNCADSLYALKRVVFEERRCTPGEAAQALANNWAGREELRRAFLCAPKFGNDIPEVDELRADIARRLYARFNAEKAALGGVFVPGEVIFTAHERCGAATGATPDGRMAGSVLADSAGASQGRDMAGPTALMNSLLRVPVGEYLLTSVVLNLRFLPSACAGRSGAALGKLVRGFFAQGGMQVQMNVCDTDTLRSAQASPEEYASLVVRVGGYSDYFTRLTRSLQEELICRTAHGAPA